MKKSILITVGMTTLLMLGGCSANIDKNVSKKTDQTETTAKADVSDEKIAKKDAEKVLNYVYRGDGEGIQKVTNQSKDEIKSYLMTKLEDAQNDQYKDNPSGYFLVVDGSHYTSDEIVKDYAEAYLATTQRLDDYKIKNVDIDGDEAEVTVELTPYAGLSEAHPIGEARTQLFGGLDEEQFINQSQNKDVKAIKNLITLKLYSMYYGDMAYTPEKAPEKTTFTFTMDKKGDNYMVSNETISKIVKESRSSTYADSSSSTDSTLEDDSNDDTL